MKINCNITIGILKNSFYLYCVRKNSTKRNKMIDNLEKAMEEHLVPIKDGRNNPEIIILRINTI